MKHISLIVFRSLTAACLLFMMAILPAYALSTDRDQPADIEADDIEFDLKNGTRTFTNNVLAVQGTLRIKADKVFAVYKKGEVDTATAWGSLARFKQRPDDKPYDVEGWAQKIIVNQAKNTLTLIGKAALKQGPDTARGDTIVYNMANDTLQLKGSAGVGLAGTSKAQPAKRKIKDDFADDGQNQGPPPVITAQHKSNDKNKSNDGEQDSAEVEEQQTPTPVPTRSGRSRLILQPK